MYVPDWVDSLRDQYDSDIGVEATPSSLSDDFWRAVELVRTDSNAFSQRMEKESKESLVWFLWNFDDALDAIRREVYLSRVRNANPDLYASENDIEELCGSIVLSGKTFYGEVFYHPELMPTEILAGPSLYEVFARVENAYKKQYAGSLPSLSSKHVSAEPEWLDSLREEFDRDTKVDEDFSPDSIEDSFWEAVDAGRQNFRLFYSRVNKMTRQELIRFAWNYENSLVSLASRLNAYITDGSQYLSTESVDELCSSVIIKGKEDYEKVFYASNAYNIKLIPAEEDSLLQLLLDVVNREYQLRYGSAIPQ